MGTTKPPVQVWEGVAGDRFHRVELGAGMFPKAVWLVDGEQVADRTVSDGSTTLEAKGRGRVVVRTTFLGKPRRATVFGRDELIGGVDLVPEEGSPAARHLDAAVDHPTRHTIVQTTAAAAGVVVPIVVLALLATLLGRIPWPDIAWPDIPWPDLPDIPWPDLPSIPWPDLPDVRVPGWVRFVAENAKYVFPVALAFVLARTEVRRRRQQHEDAGEQPREEPRGE